MRLALKSPAFRAFTRARERRDASACSGSGSASRERCGTGRAHTNATHSCGPCASVAITRYTGAAPRFKTCVALRLGGAQGPAPTPPTPPGPSAEVVKPGQLRIAANYPADVYRNDERIGNTRDREPMILSPGSHRLRIVSDLIKEHTLNFELAPGEHKDIKVNLQARHTFLEIESFYSRDCTVTVNGLRIGTLGQIQHRIRIERPDLPHTVRLD